MRTLGFITSVVTMGFGVALVLSAFSSPGVQVLESFGGGALIGAGLGLLFGLLDS